MNTAMGIMPGIFSVIVPRNSVIPASRSQIYSTFMDNQPAVEIEVFQGENPIAEENVPLGSFHVEDLPPKPAGTLQIEVHFDFDLNGILTVTATEKGQGQKQSLVVNNNRIDRLSSQEIRQAQAELNQLFELDETIETSDATRSFSPELTGLIEQAQARLGTFDAERAEELQMLLNQIESARSGDRVDLEVLQSELEDFLYYA